MTLTDGVKKICNRLAPYGWRDLLLHHELDITARDLREELLRDLPNINREIEGFEDFAAEGRRGIEPGNPARSLLYHALASPNVIRGVNDRSIEKFPTLAEIEIVENYVYGIRPPSTQDLTAKAQKLAGSRQVNMAIAVFASEYRPGSETEHRKHADVCFSRTGISRVGTAEPLYDKRRRGFLPFKEDDKHAFRVLPTKYSAYIAVQLFGNPETFGPSGYDEDLDKNIQFWVPLHKLFNGTECIRNFDLKVTLIARHVNEKIKRIHQEVRRNSNLGTAIDDFNLDKPPFKFYDGIAEFSINPDFGSGVLIPVVHTSLIEVAKYRNKTLSFLVPALNSKIGLFKSSLMLVAIDPNEPRHVPEFVHIRHRLEDSGNIRDLNESLDIEGKLRDEISKGKYRAVNYKDFTGDGWIEALCPELATEFPRDPIPAYSLVTAPDFFPNVDQVEVYEWWQEKVPTRIRRSFWVFAAPDPLSNPVAISDVPNRIRLTPNLGLQREGAKFSSTDVAVTAIVSLPLIGLPRSSIQDRSLITMETMRHTYLPDGASGVFAPGWDVSYDKAGNVLHLASYGLGSPFAEDAKLCAALSTFWPAVAPDAGRTFWPPEPTVAPLTDEEIGLDNNPSWDGAIGPRIFRSDSNNIIEYFQNIYVDYVDNALQNKFSLSLTGQVDIHEYKSRMIAIWRTYEANEIVGSSSSTTDNRRRREWPVLSFRKVATAELQELKEAQTQTDQILHGIIYRVEIYQPGNKLPHPNDHRKILVEIQHRIVSFVGSSATVLVKHDDAPWRPVETRTFRES
jgi:hypothetical protein